MQVLKDAEVAGTTTRADGVQPENPKFILEAAAIQIGLKPSICQHLWPHYVAMVRKMPLVPCICCGHLSDAESVWDIEGPVWLINRTRSLNKGVSFAFKRAKEMTGSAYHTKESELWIYNGFCESCLDEVGHDIPHALKLAMPEDPDFTTLRNLVAKALRQGQAYEAARALRRVVDQPLGSTL